MGKDTKERIFDEAISLFAQKGYTETTMRDIAKAVDIQAGSIYNHFSSKDELLSAVLELLAGFADEQIEINEDSLSQYDEITPEIFLKHYFLAFPEGSSKRYRDILKILYSEFTRNETQLACVRETVLSKYELYKMKLDELAACGNIGRCDTSVLAGLFSCIVLAYSLLSNIELNHMDEKNGNTNMFSIIKYVLDTMIDWNLEEKDTAKCRAPDF